jgi:hypothetical protein
MLCHKGAFHIVATINVVPEEMLAILLAILNVVPEGVLFTLLETS